MFVKTKIEEYGRRQINRIYLDVRLGQQKIYAWQTQGNGISIYYEAPFTEENAQAILNLNKETAAEFVAKNFEGTPDFLWIEAVDENCATIQDRAILLK